MAGALSGHILENFNSNANLVTSGPLSFNASMHGSQMFNAPFTPYSFGTQNSFASEDISEATLKKVAALQAKLNQKLGPEYISQRPGPGGGQKLTYAEGWKIINLANEVFGFNGWSSNLVNITTDFVDYDEGSKRYSIGVTAIVRVTLRDGVHHEDIGYGMIENSKSKGMALDKCKKEAVTDGLKRALRNFGNILGNCLYDKAYTQEVVKMKVAPPKFDASELHRRPECEAKPNISPSSNANRESNMDRNSTTEKSFKTPAAHPPPKQNDVNPSASTSFSVSRTAQAPAPPPPPQRQSTPINHAPVHNHQSRGPMGDTRPQQRVNQPLQRKASNTTNPDVSRNNLQPHDTVKPSPAIPPLRSSHAGSEDEFFGCSEDDAFFASVELGDADLGRPIEDEVGGPVEYEEEASVVNSNATSAISYDASHRNEVRAALPKQSAAMGLLSGLVPKHQKRSQKSSYSEEGNESISPANEIMRPSSTTGSLGGFHFPPGMNPFQPPQQQHSRPPGQQHQSFSAKFAKVETKRTAEVAFDRYQSGMKRGMGLQQGGREILGSLEIGDGGDAKRTRR
ncbi:RAD52 DNA repair protein [Amanita muscaria]